MSALAERTVKLRTRSEGLLSALVHNVSAIMFCQLSHDFGLFMRCDLQLGGEGGRYTLMSKVHGPSFLFFSVQI